jgi:hypothetical protein
LDDMGRVTINSGGGCVGSWDVRRYWFRGRARGGASQVLYSEAAFTITRAGRQALSLFRREGTTQTPLCTRPDTDFLLGAIVRCLCRFFHFELIVCRMCTRVGVVSFGARFSIRCRGLTETEPGSASFHYSCCDCILVCAIIHYTTLLAMRIHPSVAV